MTLPGEGACQPWATWAGVTSCTRADLSSITVAATQESILAQATDILYQLTNGRYPGECEITRSVCLSCSCHHSPCCCGPYERVDLGARWPVSDVLQVIVEGDVVPPTAWRVDNWRWLVRLDGEAWPRCADLTDPEAFQVTWVYGRNPSPALVRAAEIFAAEIAASCVPSAVCALPSRITNIVREGVTYTILDSQKFIDEGRTGIYLVDLAIGAANRRKARPGMFVPGGCVRRVATGTDVGGS